MALPKRRRDSVPAVVREDVKRLRKKLPPGYPVVVRSGKPSLFSVADCGFSRGRFTITIDPDEMVCERTWREILAHEWAHTLVWHFPAAKDHDSMWGVAYARCYCVVFQTS